MSVKMKWHQQSILRFPELSEECTDRTTGIPPIPSPSVRFIPSGKQIFVPAGTLLLDAAREAGLPVAQSCGGFAICSWCRMQVIDGMENLSAVEADEGRLIRREKFAADERASCQAEVLGDVVVTTRYW